LRIWNAERRAAAMNLHGCKLPLFLGEHEPNDETINAFLQHAGYHTEERY